MSRDCVDGRLGLPDLHVEGDSLHNHVDDDGNQGGEQGSQSIVAGPILGHLDHLGDDEANKVHPGNCAGEGETSDDAVQGLGLEGQSNA